ncbi:alanine/glycine:cation symporter family protein [Aquimonas voraii]|uniref:Alanine or glycine:cation symporter, AGCS family n=1 Tax=Aquimonas voraii TaxID=265719 RepID=A0A1G6ZLH0_9GAMM|nr:alanine/glycine:cation symporter family protein [Aquimonas voraii]SDE02406.1 alanine or glycine:cation symporter, AGCS family [Aquimonas voraii]
MIQRVALALLLAIAVPALAQDSAPEGDKGFESAQAGEATATAEVVATPAETAPVQPASAPAVSSETSATSEPSLDQRIEAMIRPVADAVSGFIFTSVRVGGTDEAPVMFPLIVGWLILGGLVFTLYLGFINVRGFAHGFRLLRGDFSSKRDAGPGEVSHFQALTSAVSGTVGLGNIAGVAVAITIGGPGATFWMVLAGLLGMSTKFVECTLGVKYRLEKADGTVSGGPMYYLSRGIAENYPGMKWFGWKLAIIFAICTMLGAIGAGAMFQANQAYSQLLNVTGGAEGPLAGNALWFGLAYAALAGAVVLGGISRIGSVTAKLVPSMAALYIVGCLFVILTNIGQLPTAVGAIFAGAFTGEGAVGGIIGALIVGFRRAAFSNEAGLGSSAIAHSAVKTRDPVTEGFVALWEPFVDTVVICTMTALVIIITGQYLVEGGGDGVQLTSNAFGSVVSWFPYVLTFAVLLFAFSTTITWGYYGAKAAAFMAREHKGVLYGFKIFYLFTAVLGCTLQLSSLVDIADALLFIMAIPNLIGVYLLMPVVKRELNAYWARLKSGQLRNFRDQPEA